MEVSDYTLTSYTSRIPISCYECYASNKIKHQKYNKMWRAADQSSLTCTVVHKPKQKMFAIYLMLH